MELTKYWLRYGGNSSKLFRLDELTKLPPADALLSALLRESSAIEDLLKDQNAESVDQFVALVKENSLAGYVLSCVYKRKLEDQLKELHSSSTTTLISHLSRQAASEAVLYEQFENRFVKFLKRTAALSNRLIWLKGIVLSRTIYGEPNFRLSSDFDCFIEPKLVNEFHVLLTSQGFTDIAGDSGFCNQSGVGPVTELSDLFLSPSDELIPSGVIGYEKPGWPIVDVKFNPLDRGIRMVEQERFIRNATQVEWRSIVFLAPDLIDQLIISLVHFEKDRFKGWKQLLDIKLLVARMDEQPDLWDEFIRRALVEGIDKACWAGLLIAVNRVDAQVPEAVLVTLRKKDESFFGHLFSFTVTPLFYWNTSSLLMLWANALMSTDSRRKINALNRCILPDKHFLAKYYCGAENISPAKHLLVLPLHWLVLLLPGGIVRRTFGQWLWPIKSLSK